MTNIQYEGKVLIIGGFGCGIYENSLYYLCNLSINLKLLYKKCSYVLKEKKWKEVLLRGPNKLSWYSEKTSSLKWRQDDG